MKKILIALTLIVLVLNSCTKSDFFSVGGLCLSSVSQYFVPDSREGLLTVSFKNQEGKLVVTGETNIPSAKDSLLVLLRNNYSDVVDSLVVLPNTERDSMIWGVVNVSVCNLRSGIGHDAEMVSQAILGTPVSVLKKQGGWCMVQTPDKYISWVDDDALALMSERMFQDWKNSVKCVYIPDFGIAYNSDKKPVTDLVAGSILQVEKENGTSCEVKMPDGRLFVLANTDVEDFGKWINREIPTAGELINTARQFMGRPYLWGGTSTKGIDCSGFVKTVYYLNGLILARDASLQFRHGELIESAQGWQNLAPGDLIFFGRKPTDDKPAKATHVGMYIGEGEFIHSAGMVKENSFDPQKANYSEFRSISWLGGRRVLNSVGQTGIIKISDHPWYSKQPENNN